MFTEKTTTEIITIETEIKVLGIALQKSGLPLSFDSLGKLWELYGEKYRGKMPNAEQPPVEYAICLNKVPDYIAGCSVTDFPADQAEFTSHTIPKGKYIKDSFNAESFDQLTGEAFAKRNVKAWAKKNKVKINGEFCIEVYPYTLGNVPKDGNWEMYTLTPVKE